AANPALHTSIDRLDDIMANVETATNALSVTMRNVAPVSSQLPTLVGNVDQITANLATASEDLAALAADIQKMPLDSTVNSLCAITQNLEQITTALNSRNSSLGMLIYDPSLYNNLDNTAAHLDSILIDLKRQPKKYIPAIKVF
ncbi:MAG: hypothetical protein J1E63_05265, partial [Muribaculaceae bacterium]|nr:hypothetical protein [Muribaculaceae bacterium]